MTEGMCGQAAVYPQTDALLLDLLLNPLFIHRIFEGMLLCKEPFFWPHSFRKGIPVVQDHFPDGIRHWYIAVCMVFRAPDMDLFRGRNDIFAVQVTELIQPEATATWYNTYQQQFLTKGA